MDRPPSQPEPPHDPRAQTQTAGAIPATDIAVADSTIAALSLPGYRILRRLSEGGQGIVFQGLQESTGRKVAIKVLKEGPFASAADRARFDREARVLAALDHPAIVPIIDRGVSKAGWFFLVMEYISGHRLDVAHPEMNDPKSSRDLEAILRLFIRLCDGVNAAHLRGVVHRDLKPSNVRIDERGEPRILDFGLAHTPFDRLEQGASADLVTRTGEFLGSLPWSSPEQVEGRTSAIDQRTDVYALGVMLYQLLTGRFPYDVTGTIREVMQRIVSAEPVPPSRIFASSSGMSRSLASSSHQSTKFPSRTRPRAIDSALDAIVLRALSKDLSARYSTAGELARSLADYLGGVSTSARRKRNSRLIAAISLTVAMLAVGLFFAMKFLGGPTVSSSPASPAPASPSPPVTRPTTLPASQDPLESRPGEPPVLWNASLRDLVNKAAKSGMAQPAGRQLYGDIVRFVDEPRSQGRWLLGNALTKDGQVWRLSISQGSFVGMPLTASQAESEGIAPTGMRRSADNEPQPWSYELVRLRDGQMSIAKTTGRTHLRGQFVMSVAHKQRIMDFMVIYSFGSGDERNQAFSHPDLAELSDGTIEFEFEIPAPLDPSGPGTIAAYAFLLHPRPGTYRISNELPIQTGASATTKLRANGPESQTLGAWERFHRPDSSLPVGASFR